MQEAVVPVALCVVKGLTLSPSLREHFASQVEVRDRTKRAGSVSEQRLTGSWSGS